MLFHCSGVTDQLLLKRLNMGDELQTSKRQRIAFEEKTPAPNNIKTFESFDQHYGRKYGIICDNIEVIAGTLVPDKYWCEEEKNFFNLFNFLSQIGLQRSAR